MNKLKKLLAPILVTLATLVLFLTISNVILSHEKELCWSELEGTTQTLKEEINTKITDEIVKLKLIETILLFDDDLSVDNIDFSKFGTLQSFTIFERIDVMFPDGALIADGVMRTYTGLGTFSDLVSDGERMTQRKTDFLTGRECIYYVIPIVKENVAVAVLIGVVNLEKLSEFISPTVYNDQANVCIIDSFDGAYILDDWHETLGNAFAEPEREKLKGYEDVDLQEAVKTLQTGVVAFRSQTTGKPIYMYYTSAGIFGWQLSVFAPETVLFDNYFSVRRIIVVATVVEIIFLIVYFLWNINTVRNLEKSYAEIERQREQLETLSYRDGLTKLYNRRKYIEKLASHDGKIIKKVGAVYVDLNDLKRINDTEMHDAGDRYLCRASEMIYKNFQGSAYRVGGDEFVVLAFNTEKEDFYKKTDDLIADMKQAGIRFSIGFSWCETCDDLIELLKCAEKLMYEEKVKYHEEKNKK